jgi:polyphosphate kinase
MASHQDEKKMPLINREISWLYFDERVLQEAADESVPLIERLRFLAIFSSNLDEFYRVRVATLNRLTNINVTAKKLLGFNPKRVLTQIKDLVIKLEREFDKLYDKIIQDLSEENIFIINELNLNAAQGDFIRKYFYEHVLSKLVPIVLSVGKREIAFPELNDKKVYLFVKLFRKKKSIYSLIEIPFPALSRFLVLPKKEDTNFIVLLDDIIRFCLSDLYSIIEHDKIEAYTIQLTRDAELDLDFSVNDRFIDVLTKSLQERETGKPMRLLYDGEMPKDMLDYLVNKIKLDTSALIPGNRYPNFSDFINFPNVGSRKLEYAPLQRLLVKGIDYRKSIFSQMSQSDFLVSLPYHTYDYIIHFLREAAIDPKVVSIHITLYRLAENSNVINALINAAKNGKKVQVFVELKARFDEKANIYWSKKLEKVGVNVKVVLGELKVHSKVCLVKRREKGKIVSYATLATGNFNEVTAAVYCDHNLFTVRKEIVKDLNRFFSGLKENRFYDKYESLITSPLESRSRLNALIDREIANISAGVPASMILKMNSLSDEEIIRKLYEASNAGVKIDLIVRGMCCLVPGQKGFSENIKVRSIVDRYLEHARVWFFENGGEEEVYLTSADLMTRNLDRRIEVGFPILDDKIKKELKDILIIQLQDNTKAREINAMNNNNYIGREEKKRHRSQVDIYQYLKNKVK